MFGLFEQQKEDQQMDQEEIEVMQMDQEVPPEKNDDDDMDQKEKVENDNDKEEMDQEKGHDDMDQKEKVAKKKKKRWDRLKEMFVLALWYLSVNGRDGQIKHGRDGLIFHKQCVFSDIAVRSYGHIKQEN